MSGEVPIVTTYSPASKLNLNLGSGRSVGFSGKTIESPRTERTEAKTKNEFRAKCEEIDARNIGLNGDRSGFQGQKDLMYLA